MRANRSDMLEAIRGIVLGSVEAFHPAASALDELGDYCAESFSRWSSLAATQPFESPARFPFGFYEIGLALIDANPAIGLVELKSRLQIANQTRLTGWPIFLEPSSGPQAHGDLIEAWQVPEILNVFNDASHCDFWRASIDGKLYAIRGYSEDDPRYSSQGKFIDLTLPIWRIGEGLLFADRLAETFEEVNGIAIRCQFRGLGGRRLHSISQRYIFPFGENSSVNQINEFTVSGQYTLEQVRDNLAEILHSLLARFYQNFDFFDLPIEIVRNELGRMQKNRF